MKMLKDCQRGRGEFAQGLAFLGAGEPSGDRPFEERHPFLGCDGLQEGQDPFLFHCFNNDKGVRRTDQCTEIMNGS